MPITTKAFGAINICRKNPQFDPRYIFRTAQQVRNRVAHDHTHADEADIPETGEEGDEGRDCSADEIYAANWPFAYSRGWRVRPITITGTLNWERKPQRKRRGR